MFIEAKRILYIISTFLIRVEDIWVWSWAERYDCIDVFYDLLLCLTNILICSCKTAPVNRCHSLYTFFKVRIEEPCRATNIKMVQHNNICNRNGWNSTFGWRRIQTKGKKEGILCIWFRIDAVLWPMHTCAKEVMIDYNQCTVSVGWWR